MVIYFIIMAILIALDQFTKWLIVHNMHLGQSIEVIKDFFYITSVRNTGAAWSKFSGQMTFFYIVTLIALGIFGYLLFKEGDLQNKKLYTLSLIFIISGTIGNFIDRLMNQEVVDFLHFYIFDYSFPVFNVADICLTLGTIGLAIAVVILDH